jgi:mono/diheme cytochrome c family protein
MRRLRLLPLLLLAAACERGGRRREAWDLERMREQPRYDAYGAGPRFPDGRALQRPPDGTVPRDRIVGQPWVTRGEVGGHWADSVPIPVTPALLAEGERGFRIYCAACHGAGGYGGSLVAMNMLPPRPPSLVTGHGAEHPPGYYYHAITEGTGRMPSYAAELSVTERWAVVAYLTQVLQRPHLLSADEVADSVRGEALRRAESRSAGAAKP